MKKTLGLFLSCMMLMSFAVAALAADFDGNRPINLVSREDGSGTRGAFIELVGVEVKDADGNKVDHTSEEAIIVNKTDVMLQTVAGDLYAIGYVSMGSLSDSVKALNIDGAAANPGNIKSGEYTIARPFNIVTKGAAAGLAEDFIAYILSEDGQSVVSNGYIAIDDAAPAFGGAKPAGEIVVLGSSSVAPIMEKLIEAYQALNTDAKIEIQIIDSTAGVNATIEGTCDIGMVSRELKESELEELTCTQIAIDGIAVIVSPQNPLENLAKEQVRAAFTGELETWKELQ
ncbi:MAG: substrate-binding domain-containing protein [Clostridia bacterium]|nr:substrate-binding domain-containing protein [Clostridia bacterium]